MTKIKKLGSGLSNKIITLPFSLNNTFFVWLFNVFFQCSVKADRPTMNSFLLNEFLRI